MLVWLLVGNGFVLKFSAIADLLGYDMGRMRNAAHFQARIERVGEDALL